MAIPPTAIESRSEPPLLMENPTMFTLACESVFPVLFLLTVVVGTTLAQPGGTDRLPGDIALEKGPLPADDFEKNALAVLEDIATNEQFRNVPRHDGRLLRILAHAVDAKHVVELGTSTGYSAIWFGLGLKETGGKLTTYEIDAERAAIARENFKQAGMDDLITLVEGDAHDEVKKLSERIDIIFLDADKEGYIDYLNKLLPLLRPGGLVLAHNINPRMADPKFMEAIMTNPNLETVVRGGMAITLKKT
jgi:predicted O-methyltransferase YrrM